METLCREIPAPVGRCITGTVPLLVIGFCVLVTDGVVVELVMGVASVAGRFVSNNRLSHIGTVLKAL